MNKALLDTDIYSEVLKAIHQNVTRSATTYRRAHGRLTFSVVTIMEIIQGLQKGGSSPKRIQTFRAAITPEEILAFDQDTADLAGLIAGDLDRVGRPIGRCDPMIAAVAIHHGLELVTGNTAHYQRIQQLGYSLPHPHQLADLAPDTGRSPMPVVDGRTARRHAPRLPSPEGGGCKALCAAGTRHGGEPLALHGMHFTGIVTSTYRSASECPQRLGRVA